METIGYPCVLCCETFFERQGYELHISDCLQETSNSMTVMKIEATEAQEKFLLEGEEKFKTEAENCGKRFQSMKYRLYLLGYKRCANGSVSPLYSKYFSTVHCAYCSEGFSDLTDVLEHKDPCFKTALGLKTTLHQTIKALERDLQQNPPNILIKNELKAMKQLFQLICYKLFINDKIDFDAFSL